MHEESYEAVNRTIAAAAAEAWKSGSSRSASPSTRLAKADMKEENEKKTDMGEPSVGLVVPGEVRDVRRHDDPRGGLLRISGNLPRRL
jgi:hypothetical protein